MIAVRATGADAAVAYIGGAAHHIRTGRERIALGIADVMADRARQEIRRLGAVDTGALIEGVTGRVVSTGTDRSAVVKGVMVSSGTHARVVANGRDRGTWPRFGSRVRTRVRVARRGKQKGQRQVSRTGGNLTPKFRAWASRNLVYASERELVQLAFLIARKIRKRGIRGKNYMRGAYRAGVVAAPRITENELRRTVEVIG